MYMMIKKPERNDLIIVNENKPFLYKLVGTWGYAPHPKRWREMLDWFYSLENPDTFDPYVPGLATSDWLHMHTSMNKRHMTWVSFHRKYMFYHSTDKHACMKHNAIIVFSSSFSIGAMAHIS